MQCSVGINKFSYTSKATERIAHVTRHAICIHPLPSILHSILFF